MPFGLLKIIYKNVDYFMVYIWNEKVERDGLLSMNHGNFVLKGEFKERMKKG